MNDTILREEHFELFKETCNHMINILGFTNWEINFAFVVDGHDEDMAWVNYNIPAKKALFYLNKIWHGSIYRDLKYEVIMCAIHEVCELLLAPLNYLAKETLESRHDIVVYLNHTVIRRLEKVFCLLIPTRREHDN